MRFIFIVLVSIYTYIACADANTGTLESALGRNSNSNEKFSRNVRLDDGKYISFGLNATNNELSLFGAQNTEIVLRDSDEHRVLFFGKDAQILLQWLRFSKSNDYIIAMIEIESKFTFKDSTLIGTAVIENCFEINGGELILNNLKLEFEIISERKVSNIINFGEYRGYLNVLDTSIDNVLVQGGRPLFGDGVESEMSLTNCNFNQVYFDHDSASNLIDNITGSGNVIIQDCTFTDVENALVGGVVNGLNSKGNLQVFGSSFKNCHNTKHIDDGFSNQIHTDILSGDARFSSDIFEDCTSLDFGGAINFISNGKLSISSVIFKNCISYAGKGGAVYFIGNGEISIQSSTVTQCRAFGGQVGSGGAMYIEGNGKHLISSSSFSQCSVAGSQSAEGGSLYMKGGSNDIKSTNLVSSSAQIAQSSQSQSLSNVESNQILALGGGIMAVDWLNESQIQSSSFTECSAYIGGAIYLDSTNGRIQIIHSTFTDNTASIGGGGAIFAHDTNMIYLRQCSLSSNIALVSQSGNDLHFSELGAVSDNPDMEKIKKDVIYKSFSRSDETRVYIDGIGSQIDWLPSSSIWTMPIWLIVVVSLVALTIFIVVIVLLCVCCGCLCCNKGQNDETQENSCCNKCRDECCLKCREDWCNKCINDCCYKCRDECCYQCCDNCQNKCRINCLYKCRDECCFKCRDECCLKCRDECCVNCCNCCCCSNHNVNDNNEQQHRIVEEGRYVENLGYSKPQVQQQGNGNENGVVVVPDNVYTPQSNDSNINSQYAPNQLPPQLYDQNSNPQVQYSSYSPTQMYNPMYAQSPPQDQQMSSSKIITVQ